MKISQTTGTTVQQWVGRFIRQSAMIVPLLLGLSGLTLFSQPQPPAAKPTGQLTVGFIRDTRGFEEAGCSLWLLHDRSHTDSRYILLSDFEKHAVMNIEGHDMALLLVHSSDANVEPKKGDRSMYHYRGKGVDVVVRYLVTGACAPDDESCEITDYDATLTVQTRLGKKVVRAHGNCGS